MTFTAEVELRDSRDRIPKVKMVTTSGNFINLYQNNDSYSFNKDEVVDITIIPEKEEEKWY